MTEWTVRVWGQKQASGRSIITTIPEDIVKLWGLKNSDRITFEQLEDGRITIKKA